MRPTIAILFCLALPCPPIEAQDSPSLEWGPERLVATGSAGHGLGGLHVAFNNTRLGGRDAAGRLHLVWSDGRTVFHAVEDEAGGWRGREAAGDVGRVGKPTIAFAGPDRLVLAFGAADRSGTRRARATTSADGGRTWSAPVAISEGAAESVALAAVAGGVVAAWRSGAERIEVARWNGSTWEAPRVVSAAGRDAADVALCVGPDLVIACWEESQSRGSPVKGLVLATSRDGGATWSDPAAVRIDGDRLPGSLQDACLARDAEGRFLLGFQGARTVHLARSEPGNLRFRHVLEAGPGLFAHVEAGPTGIVAVAWEHFTGRDMRDDASKTVGLSISTDGGATFDGPHAMPGSAGATGRMQAAVLVSGDRLDAVWVERSERETRIVHRSARIR